MEIIIPRRKIEAQSDEVLVQMPDGAYAFKRAITPFQTPAKIQPSEYVLLEENGRANCAISLNQANAVDFDSNNTRGFNFHEFQQNALARKLVGTTPRRFLTGVTQANAAVNGRGVLYDISGNLLEGEKLTQYANRLNHNFWAYLNARFPQEARKDTGHRGLDLVIINADGKISREPLLDCLDSDGYAELASINSQGLPTQRASVQAFKPGETIYFYPPVSRQDNPEEGYVARFAAVSARADLNCNWHPDYSNPSLGVSVCAEGAIAKK